MKRHLANAAWGVLDYVAYPATMFVVAPMILHRLGPAEYGIWTVSTAVISIGGIVASGFGDASLQRIAALRGEPDTATAAHSMIATVRNLLSIHLALGSLLALICWGSAPLMAAHLVRTQSALTRDCVLALRFASIAILLRAIETVPVSTQRAFENFGSAVRISVALRIATLFAAATLAANGQHVAMLLLSTALAMAVAAAFQYRELWCLLGPRALTPSLEANPLRFLLHTGLFTWLLALSGVVFNQLDRIVLALATGAAAATPYLLCVQFAHPLIALTGSALSFLFPHLSRKAAAATPTALRSSVLRALLCNLLLVLTGAATLLVLGQHIIRLWAGPDVTAQAAKLLPLIVTGAAFAGLSVTATYALQAIGSFRLVALANLALRSITLAAVLLFAMHQGVAGMAWMRLAYGLLCLLLYIPLWQSLRSPHTLSQSATALPEAARP